jgi:hypothetical protein
MPPLLGFCYNFVITKGNKMSFKDLKLPELKEIAESFGVDMPEKITKNALILLMQEEGVTYQDYERFSNIEKEEIEVPVNTLPPLVLKDERTILVKMDRYNMSYQVGPVTFTAEHPYMALPEGFAQEIFDNHDGFRPATPREVQEYYS